jgi:hypothetical protein
MFSAEKNKNIEPHMEKSKETWIVSFQIKIVQLSKDLKFGTFRN